MTRPPSARLVALLIGFSAIACAGPMFAQTTIAMSGLQTDPAAPIEVTSDTLSVSQSDQRAVFSSNVIITQGDLRISAETAEVSYDGASGQITELQLEGGVTLTTPTEAAESETAQYIIGTSHLTMMGNVLLTQGAMVVAGDTMLTDLRAGTAQMNGNVRSSFATGQ
ncbi:OstA-like protein [Ketogulonicigenium robustum]|uniref:OstA-like protein n=1 Tax=Ketogulonicigenium robustum TaxID=92947 RepID=A0A1W6P2H1_9RHOB|nr:LptA/OstA family protein [Ketogulonicigenium robustum]ARO15629.1 OstA-like protein [Ketogulonicigenium robustum]